MIDRFRGARALVASGRFVWPALLVLGCQTVGGTGRPDSGRSAPTVVVEAGSTTAADEAAAARLLESAEGSFEARRFFEVLRTTEELLERFPSTESSGEALRLSAIAHLEVNQREEAEAAAARYRALLSPGDPRAGDMLLIEARAVEVRDPARMQRLLEIEAGSEPAGLEEAAALLRASADSLSIDELERVVTEAPAASSLRPIAEARLAVSLLERGREEDARLFARRSLDEGVGGTERSWVEGVLRGELPPGRGRVTTFDIGVVLPLTGPPAMAQYAESIREGIEVAVATVLDDDFTITVVAIDDEGDPEVGAATVSQMAEEGVVGVVGLLLDDVLRVAGQGRPVPIPLISPTGRSVDEAGPGVYSLEGADVGAARSIAEYGAGRAFQRIAMLYPAGNPAARLEADAFEARAAELGMPVVGRFEYEPGAVFFESEILGARDALRREEIASLGLTEDDTLHVELLEPVALFMPLPPEDVEFVAPQVIHFGLDTLAIEILGTSGWTDPQALDAVDARLTTGVIATRAAGADPGAPGPTRFKEAYEEHFQRSLVSQAPAVGYDAALILLEALRQGRIDPEQLRAEVERLEAIEGATGIFSVRDGRIVRATEVVRIQDGVAQTIPRGAEPPARR
ncbi:MAG: ABC transporter substrate-binding protein [Gemmatimonadota bacterium]|nr:ABC transporter substrate-binding protein [Gemmatimonadota bacterium]